MCAFLGYGAPNAFIVVVVAIASRLLIFRCKSFICIVPELPFSDAFGAFAALDPNDLLLNGMPVCEVRQAAEVTVFVWPSVARRSPDISEFAISNAGAMSCTAETAARLHRNLLWALDFWKHFLMFGYCRVLYEAWFLKHGSRWGYWQEMILSRARNVAVFLFWSVHTPSTCWPSYWHELIIFT